MHHIKHHCRENEVRQLANWIESVEKISRELTIESRKVAALSESEEARHVVRSAGFLRLVTFIMLHSPGTVVGSTHPHTMKNRELGQCAALLVQINGKCMKLRSQFFSELRRQLYNDVDDQKFFDDVSTSLRCVQRRLHESTAAVTFLREQLFLVTCDDPGPLITMKLVLPMLRERLDTLADAHAAKQAEAAEAELLLVRCGH